MRRGVGAAAVAAAVLLAGCSSSSDGPPSAAESKAPDVAWNPCDGLTAAGVSRIAGEPVTMQTGTVDQPRCTFVPKRTGGPAYDVSYLFFDGGLDTALDSMGAAGSQLRPVTVPGADAARIAVRERRTGILVTGFVQTQGVVQSVNAVHLKPYDRDAFVTSTTDLLAALARSAPTE
ncbi:DUF3558 family protein [Nocardioides aquiterrae]|uniref:DUF3558 domain-containing protein n=1 Tax=Nocardioides aquiterrae TaxID=203799 RepID=A0ABN1UMI8_9ACTN